MTAGAPEEMQTGVNGRIATGNRRLLLQVNGAVCADLKRRSGCPDAVCDARAHCDKLTRLHATQTNL